MTARRTLFSWQPVLTDHMAFTLMELGRKADANVRAISTVLEDSTRREQGWTATNLPGLQVELLPGGGWYGYVERILRHHPDALHIVVSPFGARRITGALLLALLWRREVYLVSEPYSPLPDGYLEDRRRWSNRLKAWLRPLVYRSYGLLVRGRIRGVFAISPLAVDQYVKLGVPANRVFPFGYFVPASEPLPNPARSSAVAPPGPLQLAFVGSLIRRKGVDQLVTAVKQLAASGVSVTLDLFGPGDAGAIGADGTSVRYRGRIPFGQTGRTIANHDLLVVPSLHDGWGVVVNEAIQAGVPVACSARVGAAAMVRLFGCGWVFEPPDVETIAATLRTLAADRSLLSAARAATLRTAELLTPAIAGQYMFDVIQSVGSGTGRPQSPWYR